MRVTKTIVTFAAALALSTPVLFAQADTQSAPPPPPSGAMEGPGPGGMHHGGGMERDMERRLNLTADQRTQFRQIMKAQHEKGRAIHENTALSEQDRHAQMKANMEDTHTQIRAILNDEQKQKFDAMVQHHREMREDHMNGGDGPPPPPPGV